MFGQDLTQPIYEVEEGQIYLSPSRLPFKVLHRGSHGQDCSQSMIVYTNITPTYDTAAGHVWVMCESLFLKLFRASVDGMAVNNR